MAFYRDHRPVGDHPQTRPVVQHCCSANNMTRFLTIAFLALLKCSSSGAIVMIQQEEIGGGALHFSAEGFGQSFTTDKGFLALGIELHMKASPFGARTTTVEVFKYNEAMTTFGNILPIAKATITSDRISNTQSWVMADFLTPVLLESNSSYAFVASDGTTSSNQFYFSSANAYVNGSWLNIGSGGGADAKKY